MVVLLPARSVNTEAILFTIADFDAFIDQPHAEPVTHPGRLIQPGVIGDQDDKRIALRPCAYGNFPAQISVMYHVLSHFPQSACNEKTTGRLACFSASGMAISTELFTEAGFSITSKHSHAQFRQRVAISRPF